MNEGEQINRKTFQAYFLWAWHDYTEWLKANTPDRRHPVDRLLAKHGLSVYVPKIYPTLEGFMVFLAEQEYE